MFNFYDWLESKSLGDLAVIDSKLSNDIDNELRDNEAFKKNSELNFPRIKSSVSFNEYTKEKNNYILDVNKANEYLNNALFSLINPFSDDIQEAYADYVLDKMECS